MTTATIAREIEAQILKACGATIEWTFRAGDEFTISGQSAAVASAVEFCQSAGIAILSGPIEHDEETEESYAYVSRA
jgi:hypothetical protein